MQPLFIGLAFFYLLKKLQLLQPNCGGVDFLRAKILFLFFSFT